jgi:hypothetical protein
VLKGIEDLRQKKERRMDIGAPKKVKAGRNLNLAAARAYGIT